ncbi:hypothetical protein pben1_p12 [Paracoccus phage vB_PbeS_Pben1]|uniref:Uncharacterized protein YfdQ (DUF2303 family) n=1 Tax=Paracoccus versutus TaxID=34007 RepID=A0A3D9XPB3_PARVE|nr:DUF2303 family protein [Paracoccus versutus]AZV00169.1 hypothetical protein pben1_p12 [Paracoccus phage vB_PbeS_Pben1]REF72286.1 uncharacterized protein YfdQ (DUF2303 family) [Paracoccus versutus]WGR55730.1 DUF2303 family protein [Paracoccus versutus]
MAQAPGTPPYVVFEAEPQKALDAAMEAARIASPVIDGPDGRTWAALPERIKLHDISDPNRLASRVRQTVTVDDRASLSAYANRYKSGRSIIIADFDALTISARLDWHEHNQGEAFPEPGHNAHAVTLALRPSEEFSRWDEMEGKIHPQADFARFLEENSVDVGTPEAATMIEISRDFEATVGQVYKSAVRLDNGDRKLVFESDTKVQEGVIIPEKFTLSIPIYNGEEPEELTCLFRWRAAGGGGVGLGFQWHRVEYQRRAHFTQIATAASEETGLPVYMGRFS